MLPDLIVQEITDAMSMDEKLRINPKCHWVHVQCAVTDGIASFTRRKTPARPVQWKTSKLNRSQIVSFSICNIPTLFTRLALMLLTTVSHMGNKHAMLLPGQEKASSLCETADKIPGTGREFI